MKSTATPTLLAFALCLTALPALADTSTHAASSGYRGYAGTAFGSPSAFSLGWGKIGAGFYLQTQQGGENNTDGSAAFTLGAGNAQSAVAVDTSVSVSSLIGSRGSSASFGEVGALSFKVSRELGQRTAVAFGVLAATSWGFTKDLEQPTYYVVATHVVPLQSFLGPRPLVITGGLATSGYDDDASGGRDSQTRALASAAFYLNRQTSIVADYTGRFLNLGVSVAPFESYPATITLGAVNLNDANDLGTQFGISIAASFTAF